MRVITAGSSIAAIIFICQPQVAQVSRSILNTRFSRCAPGHRRVAIYWRLLRACRVTPSATRGCHLLTQRSRRRPETT